MNLRTHLWIVVACLSLSACDPKSAPEPESNPEPVKAVKAEAAETESAPSAATTTPADAFPKHLGDWKLDGWKPKTKDWGKAYSSTYKNGGDELKVVINDAAPDGVPAWDAFFTGKELDGRPMAIDAKADKVTLMVRVGKRFRVDFKSRNPDGVALEATAKKFDFSKVETIK